MNLFRAVSLLLAVAAIAGGLVGYFIDDTRTMMVDVGYGALMALGVVLLGFAARNDGATRVR